MDWRSPSGKLLRIELGDITRIPVDAIVNAANSSLSGGGGVDGAIHRAGGPSLMQELRRFENCRTGSAVVTHAGKLPAKWVFHAVGPVYRDGKHGEPELLRSCYSICFELAELHKARTISFPAISTGVYGYPLNDAAKIAVVEAKRCLTQAIIVEEVYFVMFGETALRAFNDALES